MLLSENDVDLEDAALARGRDQQRHRPKRQQGGRAPAARIDDARAGLRCRQDADEARGESERQQERAPRRDAAKAMRRRSRGAVQRWPRQDSRKKNPQEVRGTLLRIESCDVRVSYCGLASVASFVMPG